MPFRPKGGSLYVVKTNEKSKNDWKADGYAWTNQGTKSLPRKDPKYRKSYFYIKDKDGKPNAGFRKDVFFPLAQDTAQQICIVHYIGNERQRQRNLKPGRKRARPGDTEEEQVPEPMEQIPEQAGEVEQVPEPMEQFLEQAEATEQDPEPMDQVPEQTRAMERPGSTEPPLPELPVDISIDENDTSFNRDVRYSLEVWVPADKIRLMENLNVGDRQLLTNRDGWLNGTLIDAAMTLLKHQYPTIGGLQSSALAIQLDFERHESFLFK